MNPPQVRAEFALFLADRVATHATFLLEQPRPRHWVFGQRRRLFGQDTGADDEREHNQPPQFHFATSPFGSIGR